MTKFDFIRRYKEKGGYTHNSKAERKLNLILEIIADTVEEGEEVSFLGWGKFYVKERAARGYISPRTGERINRPAKRAIKFKPGKLMLEKINK